MRPALSPVPRRSLSDHLASRIRELIQEDGMHSGDRLPSIAEMARRFGVGHISVREALKKLQTLGIVGIRHGSGVYVGRDDNSLIMSNPVFSGSVTQKLLLDLIEARIPMELTSAALAARHATEDHLARMRALLQQAGESLDDDVALSSANMAFHLEIASGSGNTVLSQLLDVLTSMFTEEQRLILDIYGSRQKDHREHLGILHALEQRDPDRAVALMNAHLSGVRDALVRWEPGDRP